MVLAMYPRTTPPKVGRSGRDARAMKTPVVGGTGRLLGLVREHEEERVQPKQCRLNALPVGLCGVEEG